MIILHNKHDKDSREFVDQAKQDYPDIQVMDWYSHHCISQWCASGSTLQVSAFPSVALEMDELVGGDYFVSRKPESIDAAIIDKKVHETKLLITAGDTENAQAWINDLSELGYNTTYLQNWLDTL